MSLKVYYLDDEKDLLEMFSDTFSTPDIQITNFSEPALFMKAVKASPPDIIFLDFRLPGCTGDEIAQQIDPNIPKVLITGDTEVRPKASFLAVLGKPYRSQSIEDILRTCQSLKKAS